mmetsp:Transcript_151777/g.487010  ORF Transcript_151777/g.487010 Transcript_151777/m.487010 type:complete len:127 (-) Transcript_151777:26-406(-)
MAVRTVATIDAGCRGPLLKWRRQDSACHGALVVLQLQMLLLQECMLPTKTKGHTQSASSPVALLTQNNDRDPRGNVVAKAHGTTSAFVTAAVQTTSTNNAIMARRHGVRAEGFRIEHDCTIAEGWL